MSSIEHLSRDDIIHVLKGMNIDLASNTRVNTTRLQNRLGEALDAAQRFSTTFPTDPDVVGGVNLSNYPMWKKRTPVVDAFTRRTWAAIFQDNREFEDQRQLAFPRIVQLIPDIGKSMDQKRIGYVVLKDMTIFRALIIRVRSSLHSQALKLISAYSSSLHSRLTTRPLLFYAIMQSLKKKTRSL